MLFFYLIGNGVSRCGRFVQQQYCAVDTFFRRQAQGIEYRIVPSRSVQVFVAVIKLVGWISVFFKCNTIVVISSCSLMGGGLVGSSLQPEMVRENNAATAAIVRNL